jgi:hypothetical protein
MSTGRYFNDDPGRRSNAKLLIRDEAQTELGSFLLIPCRRSAASLSQTSASNSLRSEGRISTRNPLTAALQIERVPCLPK